MLEKAKKLTRYKCHANKTIYHKSKKIIEIA
ncbi:hypothetical protein SAMN05444397_103394 [Flavobacterium aquidurense]|nr:hypothetical protein SAMN05444397_103394 [Flavobacterium aquidurense]